MIEPSAKAVMTLAKYLFDYCDGFEKWSKEKTLRVAEGIVEGIARKTVPDPSLDLMLPGIRPAFDEPYEMGYDLGALLRIVAKFHELNPKEPASSDLVDPSNPV